MSSETAIALMGELVALAGIAIPLYLSDRKKNKGQRCVLRSEMLRTYYRNRDNGEIRQYEYENFVFLYEAYKELKGNSFIDKIYDEVKKWKVIP